MFSPALNTILSRVSNETVVDIMKIYAALPSHIEIGGLKFAKSTLNAKARNQDELVAPKIVIVYRYSGFGRHDARYYISSNDGGQSLGVVLFVGFSNQPTGRRSVRSDAASNEIIDAMQSIYDTAVANANRGRNV